MKEQIRKERLIIIGGGPAGLSAAIYAARAGLEPLVLNGPEPGGQITTTSELENYPGFPEGIGGFEIMQKFTRQAEKFDARMVFETVEAVNFREKPYTIKTDTNTYRPESVIIATGSEPRKLGLDKEKELTGSGVSYCATCDGAFFKDKEIAVVGGGNVALEEATYLTGFASKVNLIHRRDKFRGSKILADRVRKNEKIVIHWDSEIKEILGEKRVDGLILKNSKSGEKKRLDSVKGLFIAVGYKPRTDVFGNSVQLDDKGYIITDEKQQTSKEGVFAAGDVQDPVYQQVITSAASGAKAAIQVYKHLEGY